MENGILILGLLILVGFVGSLLYKKTKIPESIFLIIIGILLGPIFNLVSPVFFLENASFLISIALVVVLLDSGIGLNIVKAMKNIPVALFFTISVTVLTALAVAFVTTYFFGWNVLHGLFLGIVVSGTTTITVAHLIERLSLGKNTKTLLILESVLNDIVIILSVSIILSFVAAKGSGITVPKIIFDEVIVSILAGLAFAVIWAFVFLKFIRGSKLSYVFTLGLAFTIFSGMEFIGYNGAVTVLIFGLLLGNYSHLLKYIKSHAHIFTSLKDDVSIVRSMHTEITFIMRTLFFVFLGIIFDMNSLGGSLLIISLAVLGAEVVARLMASGLLIWVDSRFKRSVPIISSIVASGFTSTLAAFLSLEAGIEIPNLAEIVLLLVMLTTIWSIATTGIFSYIADRRKTKTH